MTAAHPHPTDDALARYGLGTLDDAAGTVIDQHLTTCPDCRRRVAEVSADGFLDRLQSAVGESTPGPTGTAVQGDTDGPPVVPGAAADILARLQSLSQYENVRPLGQGGMGAVFLARNVSFKRDEVLKVVIPSRVGSADAMARFQQEIEAIGQLNHPNVVTPYATHRVGDLLVLSMEFAGDSLDSHLTKTGPLPIPDACRFVAQAADGLQHAFEKQVVHRDIKPSNLLLTTVSGKPVVKIVDFGLAKAREEARAEESSRGLTGDGVVMGTLAYLSPEQARDSKSADIRTDVYALGCTLYALLTGRPPFAADSPTGFLFAHAQDAPPRLDALRPDVPPKLAEVALKMLAKDPADRHQTPAEVATAMQPFVTGGTTVDWTPPAEPTRSWKKPAAVAAAVLVGLAVVVAAASTLFVKTKEGTIELTDLAPDAEVFVDGDKMSVKWADGKQSAEIRIPAGTRKLEVKRNGVTVVGERLEIAQDGRKVVSAKFVHHVPGLVENDDPPPSPPVPPEKDFVALFNGKDTTGWERTGNTDSATLRVVNGVLVGNMQAKKGSMPSTIRSTKGMYRNFHLRLRTGRPIGSGAVLYLFDSGPRTRKYRIALGSTEPDGPDVGRLMVLRNDTTPQTNAGPIGRREWYTMDVIVQGNRIRVLVNGTETADHTDDLPTEPTDIRFHVSAATNVRFQSVEVKELPAPPKNEFTPLFNGKDLTGWEQVGRNEAAVWKVVNGAIVGSWPPNADVTGGSSLKLAKSPYRHFHLKVRAMKSEVWESRLYLFTGPMGTGGRYRVSLGSPDDKPNQEVGRLIYLRDGLAPLRVAPKIDAKKWFTLNVIVQGNRVTVDVDGLKTADHTDERMPGENCEIKLGLAGGGVVRFQSVEIKELPAPK